MLQEALVVIGGGQSSRVFMILELGGKESFLSWRKNAVPKKQYCMMYL